LPIALHRVEGRCGRGRQQIRIQQLSWRVGQSGGSFATPRSDDAGGARFIVQPGNNEKAYHPCGYYILPLVDNRLDL
jgi:hypothetical protein